MLTVSLRFRTTGNFGGPFAQNYATGGGAGGGGGFMMGGNGSPSGGSGVSCKRKEEQIV